jgi:hypothetical protein
MYHQRGSPARQKARKTVTSLSVDSGSVVTRRLEKLRFLPTAYESVSARTSGFVFGSVSAGPRRLHRTRIPRLSAPAASRTEDSKQEQQ